METLEYLYEPDLLKSLGRDTPVSRAEIEKIIQKQEIIYLKLADMSYNQIIEYFRLSRGVFLTKYYIASVIREAGIRAKQLNGMYDARVSVNVRIIEVDEIFQGSQNCYLGVVAKKSHYLLVFTRLEDRTSDSFTDVLEHLAEDLEHLELVITDALKAYKSVIPEVFEGILHVICHVHACRVFFKEGHAINSAAKKAATAASKMEESLAAKKNELREKKRRLRRLEKRVAQIEANRLAFLADHGLKKHAKTRRLASKRRAFNAMLNVVRASIRNLKTTIASIENAIQEKMAKLAVLKKDATAKKQVALQSGRLIARFRHLLDCEPKAFEAELARYQDILDRSTYPIAKKIKKFIKNNPEIYATNLPGAKASCPLNLVNTNTIEGEFGLSRPVLNKAKHFFDSDQSEALLEVYRLKLNMSTPYTGPNRNQSPLARAGVHTSFSTWWDALFPLPGGAGPRDVDLDLGWSRDEREPGRREDGFRQDLERCAVLSRNLANHREERVNTKRVRKNRRRF